MILLNIEEIKNLHAKLIQKTGGSGGLRDIGLLESAVYSTEAGFEDYELYPTTEQKAARLMFALIQNHAFVDGNKRIGTLAMLLMLKANGIVIKYSQTELINLALDVANGMATYEDILSFIMQHEIH